MNSLRGVMVDAECPRCGQTSPPPESVLATCKRCGLVFPPHEVQHKLAAPDDDNDALVPLPTPPPGVIARRDGQLVRIEWSVARYVALFYFSAALFTAWFAASEILATPFWIATAIGAVLGVQQLLAKHVIELRGAFVSHFITWRFGFRIAKRIESADSIEIRKERFARYELRTLEGRRATIARSIDRAPLDYATELIRARP
jgi:hypothetical protein